MKKYFFNIIIFFNIIFFSCDFNDQEIEYQQKLVVFGTIVANLPITDTVTVSRSASISEDVLSEDLWIDDAEVYIINDLTKDSLQFKNFGSGKYFPLSEDPLNYNSDDEEFTKYKSYIINPGATYSLVVNHEIGSVIATTQVPSEMNIFPADLGEYNCPNGEVLPTKIIDVNNFDNVDFQRLYQDPNSFIADNDINVDSVTYRIGECFTQSFASYPMFGVDFNADSHQTVKIIVNSELNSIVENITTSGMARLVPVLSI